MKRTLLNFSYIFALLLSLLIGLFSCVTSQKNNNLTNAESAYKNSEDDEFISSELLDPSSAVESFESDDDSKLASLPDTDLIYYEDFESYGLLKSNKSVYNYLGWEEQSLLSGAPSNNTTLYKIRDYYGNRKLLLTNNESGCTDSYVTVLSSAMMGKYHESNYTYQYDILYTDASTPERYIAMISDYSGNYFNSFHLRNKGVANNQCYYNDKWYTYDSDTDSLVTTLLGFDHDENVQSLSGIDLTIRYVVDWDNGNSVYIRINSEGYPGSGIWTLVSKLDIDGDNAKLFSPKLGSGALVLKTGGKQNGYVDNITVWRGTGDEPVDKSVTLLDAIGTQCSGHLTVGVAGSCTDPERCLYCGEIFGTITHDYVKVYFDKDNKCQSCGVIESNIGNDEWYLANVPIYKDGVLSKTAYECGQGTDNEHFPYKDESFMMIASKTSPDEFLSYCNVLEDYGYENVYSFSRDDNLFAQFRFGNELIYTYYTANSNEVRIIDDKSSHCTNNDFGYRYVKSDDDETIVYQIGLPMNSKGQNINDSTEKKINCGMMYAIKAADNSVIIIDGGGQQQFDEAQCDYLMSFLREITGAPAEDKVRISAWYITHGHSDHMAGFCVFSGKYHNEVSIERIMFNFPSGYSDDKTQAEAITNYNKLLGYVNDYYGDAKYIKLHSGQCIDIADVRINVLYTHEDLVNPKTAESEANEDYNNGSTVSVFEFDGKKFFVSGDINRIGMNVLLEFNSANTLKSDIVQCAHHCLNNVYEMYDQITAPIVFMPQSPQGCLMNSTRANIFKNVTKYVENDMLFYASEGTYGLKLVNGQFEQVYFSECVGGEYTGWGW